MEAAGGGKTRPCKSAERDLRIKCRRGKRIYTVGRELCCGMSSVKMITLDLDLTLWVLEPLTYTPPKVCGLYTRGVNNTGNLIRT